MQASLSKNYSNGLTFKLAYTWGKLLDQYSATNLGQFPQDPANPAGDRARSDFDRRIVFSGSIVYQIPFYRNANIVVRQIFSKLAVNSLIQMSVAFLSTSSLMRRISPVGYDRPNVPATARPSQLQHRDRQVVNSSIRPLMSPITLAIWKLRPETRLAVRTAKCQPVVGAHLPIGSAANFSSVPILQCVNHPNWSACNFNNSHPSPPLQQQVTPHHAFARYQFY
jgi:hypothetical protein